MAARRNTSREWIVETAIEKAGGVAEMARALSALPGRNISPQAISMWKRIPIEWVNKVEMITGIPRTALRPDVYAKDL